MSSRALFVLLAALLTSFAFGCGGTEEPPEKVVSCTGAGAPSCGVHGACDAGGDKAVCVCQGGYAGAACDTCADGFQDQDGDGTCQPTCATAGLTCAVGTCSDVSGTATCDCEASSCGAHGTCDDASGSPVCTCSGGYTGATCDACAAGSQDHDADGTCAPSCDAASCGGHGSCDDSSGAVVCTCDASHVGATCDACAAGLQDNDHDGSCEADCSGFSACPGAHQACSDASGTAACACAPGFSDSGAGCTWAGSLRDPGFDGTPADAWSVEGGATVVPAQSEALFSRDAICSNPGAVRQTFSLPNPPPAPLALSVRASATCDGDDCDATGVPQALAVELGGKRAFIEGIGSDFGEHRVCLGEAAFAGDGEVSLALTAGRKVHCTVTTDMTLAFDHVDVVSDETCPPLGSLINGDFSAGADGWTLDARRTGGSASASATVIPAGPLDGSPAASLHLSQTCNVASASTLVSLPLATGLRLHANAQVDAGQQVLLGMDGAPLGALTGTGTPQAISVCLPPGLEGTVHALSFSAPDLAGACDTPVAYDLFLDDVSVAEDASCATATEPADPGFETLPTAAYQPWTLERNAAITQASAHSGAQGLSFYDIDPGNFAVAKLGITVPRATATEGPALRFWWKTATATLQINLGGDVYQTRAGFGGTWKEAVLCLPPERGGAFEELSLVMVNAGGATTNADVDDVQVTTSPSCPVQ